MSERTPEDILAELKEEGLQLNLESIAAALITMQGRIDYLSEKIGATIDGVKLDESAEKRRNQLIGSISKRMMRVATLSAEAAGQEIDQEKLAKNVLTMLEGASKTKGASITEENALTDQIFEGLDVDVDAEIPDASVKLPTVLHTTEPDDVPDDSTIEEDNDLMAVFKTARTQKQEATDTHFVDDKVTGHFFNPESLPETPEEFAEYDNRAVDYFKNMVALAEKADVISTKLADQVRIVLQGGVNFTQADVIGDGSITKAVLAQGQDRSDFEIVTKNPRDVSETIIAAYSVSIARLRGAYVQAKLGELAAHMSNNGQSGPKF